MYMFHNVGCEVVELWQVSCKYKSLFNLIFDRKNEWRLELMNKNVRLSQFSTNISIYQLHVLMIYRYCKSIKIFEYLWIYLQFMKLGLQSKTNNNSKCYILWCSFSNSIATVLLHNIFIFLMFKFKKRKIWNISLYNFYKKILKLDLSDLWIKLFLRVIHLVKFVIFSTLISLLSTLSDDIKYRNSTKLDLSASAK